MSTAYERLDTWVDAHFDEEVKFLQALVRVPTDTPPGNNAPHAERTAELLQGFGYQAEKHPVPAAQVQAYGLQSITNLIVRRRFGAGPTIALNAHGDVVPPGEGWTHDPYGGEVVDGSLYGRAAAVSGRPVETTRSAPSSARAWPANTSRTLWMTDRSVTMAPTPSAMQRKKNRSRRHDARISRSAIDHTKLTRRPRPARSSPRAPGGRRAG